jgi:hypothetical protein
VVLNGVNHLIATIQIKNIGSSRIDFDREGSALILYEYTASSDPEVYAAENRSLASFDVFDGKRERYVEPKEAIEVQQLIAFRGPLKLAYRLETELFSTSGFWWGAESIVHNLPLEDNVAS